MTATTTGVIVRASAGTGKTHRLAMRCLGVLASGEPIDAILATTFTRKAAGEIRARILRVLAEVDGGNAKTLGMVAKDFPGLTPSRARELLVHVVSRMHRMQVMTIDALSARMASVVAFDIGLTPGWRVIDDLEDDDVRLRALDRVLEQGGNDAMLPLLHDLNAGTAKASIHRTVLAFVGAGERAWRACGGDAKPWETVPALPGMLEAGALAEALRRLEAARSTVRKKDGEVDGRWAKAHASATELALAERWGPFLETKMVDAAEGGTFHKVQMPADMRSVYLPVRDHAAAVLIHRHRARAHATRKLIDRFMPVYEALKDESSVLRFEDFPRMLRRATEQEFASAYFRMDTRFRHILLDEFQDTSADQFALLDPMIDEVVAGSEEHRSVLIVGDPKQTLYSWRNAAPGLMSAVVQRWPGKFAEESQTVSWRSSPAVLDAVNAVFESVTEAPVLQGSAGAAQMRALFQTHSAQHIHRPGEVTVREIGEPEALSEEESDAPAWAIETANLVQEILRHTPDATIGVLTRKGKTAGRIISVLRGRAVFASAERGTPLGDTPAVAAFASVLTLIEHPGHTQAAFHVATSPVGRAIGITAHDDRARIAREIGRMRRSMFSEGVAPECARILRKCASEMDARAVRRFEQLVEMCEAFDRDPSDRLDDLTRQIWSVPVEDPSASRVRVMTIHAAKGLEFDAVILPELGDRWSVSHGDVMVDHPDPLRPPAAVTPYASALLRRLSPELDRIHRATLERDIMDELCVLYVGMTRAISRLELLLPSPTKGERENGDDPSLSAASVIRGALGIHAGGEPGAVLKRFSHGAKVAAHGATEAIAHRPGSASAPPRFTMRGGERSAWRLERKSPSTMGHQSRAPLGDRSELAGAGRYGELMHAWFEGVEWSEQGVPSREALMAEPCAWGMDAGRVERAMEQFRTAMASGEIRALLSREAAQAREPGADAEVRMELPFVMRSRATTHGAMISGRMDRVTIGWKGGAPVWVEIVDFKTDAHDAGNPGWLDERIEAHRAQMEAYRSAAVEMFGVPIDRVGVSVVFTSVPGVARVDPA